MSVDEMVGRALRDLADEVRPEHDPYGRIRVRHRRSRRRRTAVVATTVAGALAVAGAVAPGRAPEPPPATGFDAVRVWEQRLADTPVRGKVALADPGYVAAVAQLVGERRRAGLYLGKYSVRQEKVLYVDDVGPWRIAIVALALTDPSPSSWTHASATFVAPRGSDAATLTRMEALRGYGDGLEPFYHVELSDVGTMTATVALAPAGCTVSSAAWPELNRWQAEPTGSFLTRDAASARPEWWRVECGGVLREQMPAPYDTGVLSVTTKVVDQEMLTARGTPDRRYAQETLTSVRNGGVLLSGMPRLVWGGRVAWPDGEAKGRRGITTVAAAPHAFGGWYGEVSIRYDDDQQGLGNGFFSSENPADPHATVAVRFESESSGVLVIAPEGAVSVRAVVGDSTVAEAPVADDAAVLTVADPSAVAYEALDRDGRVVGRTRIEAPPAVAATPGWSAL
ncbi:hypothetical protein AB0H43_10580 [Hamadaea sp. NPDC050747]|uniref:hypothetical protein n=1 Tax=Hamadaea sp. NPDC050747 TaxID=3155789 RepID=UPI0033C99D3A